MHTETLRVLHVISRFNSGGTAQFLGTLLPQLNAEKVDYLLAVGRTQHGEIEDSGLLQLNFRRVEGLGRRISFVKDIKAYFSLRKLVKDFKPQIIHSHTFKAGLLCRMMYFRTLKAHTYHGHLLDDPEFAGYKRRLILFIEKSLALVSSILFVTGKQVADDLIAAGVGTKEKYLSVPGQQLSLNLTERKIARERLGLTEEFIILWLARVAIVKNPKLLIKIAELMPDCIFLMAGVGPELEEITKLAPSNLKVLGFVSPGEIMLAADVFLSTSSNEGVPYSVMEAQFSGLPIVAVDVGAISERVKDGVNGYLVGPLPSEICAKIESLRADDYLRRKFALNARDLAQKSLLKDSVAKLHIKAYEELLKTVNSSSSMKPRKR
jgi:glycosyltransferase involved in cell wall biosynthesis